MTTKTLRGPDGLTILLDKSEVNYDDPGTGTPAMVQYDNWSATYWCAYDTGELTYEGRTFNLDDEVYFLTNQQLNWLRNRDDEVNTFLYED